MRNDVIDTRLHDPSTGELHEDGLTGLVLFGGVFFVIPSFRSRFLPLNHESFERRLPIVRIGADHVTSGNLPELAQVFIGHPSQTDAEALNFNFPLDLNLRRRGVRCEEGSADSIAHHNKSYSQAEGRHELLTRRRTPL